MEKDRSSDSSVLEPLRENHRSSPPLLSGTNPGLVLNGIVQIKVSSSISMPGSVSFHPSQLQCLEPDSPGHSRVSTDRKKQE